MQEQKKILILYTSVGLGHKSIAENIGSVLSQAGHTVKLEDVLKIQSGFLVNFSKKIHRLVNLYTPSVWSFLYQNKWFINLSLPWRIKIAGKNYLNTQLVVENFQPDIIISTQTTASAIVAFLKQQNIYKGKFGIAFSDFHLHRYWLYQEADFYLANIKEQKQEMEELGIGPEKIFICGIALSPKPEVNAEGVKKKLGIAQNQKTVLISSGSQGLEVNKDLLYSLSQKPQFKIVVVCGKNEKLFNQLSGIFAGSNILILGYYSPMDELYAIADVFVTKPGGLSVAEALRWRLPILISHMLPGQEELNYSFLQDTGLVMPEPINLESELIEELERHNFKEDLLKNGQLDRILSKPEVIVEAVKTNLN